MFGGVLSEFGARILDVQAPEDREALDLVEQILQKSQAPSAGGESEPFQLRQLTPYLKAYRFQQDHSWALPAMAVGIFAGIFLLGYVVGKR